MGNLLNTLKRFVGNKNTVTILGVLAGVIVLWAFYSYRVKQATSPLKVPYAKVALNATSEITSEDVGMVEINSRFTKTADILRSTADVVGKYVATGTSIPMGGLFYRSQVVDKSEIPNTIFDNIEKGFTVFSLKVDNHTTYGNSIYPGDKIDLYLKATDEDNMIMFGSFIQNIEVLAVRDGQGKNVFGSTDTKTPAELLFAVDNAYFELLKKAEYIQGVSLIVVPRNQAYYAEAGELKPSEYLVDFILSQTADIPEDMPVETPFDQQETPTEDQDTNKDKKEDKKN